MLRRRNHPAGLPLTTNSNELTDGSGRAIKIDSSLLRATKNASSFTIYSYLWLIGSTFFVWWGWSFVQYRYASIYMECETSGCHLLITPPKRAKAVEMFIDRTQILETMLVQVDKDGTFFQRKQIKQNYEARDESQPDENGKYDSYAILLHPDGEQHIHNKELEKKQFSKDRLEILEKYGTAAFTDPRLMEQLIARRKQRRFEAKDKQQQEGENSEPSKSALPSLESLNSFVTPNDMGEYILPLRFFNVGHSNRGCMSQYNKIQSYLNKRRTRIYIQENRNVAWQGILIMVIGCVSFLVSILSGQFWEPKPLKQRRSQPVKQIRSRGEKNLNPLRNTRNKDYQQSSY